MIKNARYARRLLLRQVIEGYLMTSSPLRHHQTTAQIKAAAKQMEQSNRIPVVIARALMEGVTKPETLEETYGADDSSKQPAEVAS